MNFDDPIKFSGSVDIVKYDDNGTITEKIHVKNLVVDAGKALIAKLVSGNTATAVTHMAVGTSSTAAAASQTTLVTEVGRVALTTKTASANVMSFIGIFPAGTATGSLQEAALFNAASSGDMMCRSTFSSISKGANDTVSITWTITIG